MERQHEKNEIINRFYEIKDEMNLLEKSIRMINSSSRTGYKMNIEYNRLINNYQQLNQESHELLKRLFVITLLIDTKYPRGVLITENELFGCSTLGKFTFS